MYTTKTNKNERQRYTNSVNDIVTLSFLSVVNFAQVLLLMILRRYLLASFQP